MSKKHDEPKLTPEQEKLAAEMVGDFEKLAQAEKAGDMDDPKPPKVTATIEEPRPSEPERFYSGGATAEEIACYREVHGKG